MDWMAFPPDSRVKALTSNGAAFGDRDLIEDFKVKRVHKVGP